MKCSYYLTCTSIINSFKLRCMLAVLTFDVLLVIKYLTSEMVKSDSLVSQCDINWIYYLYTQSRSNCISGRSGAESGHNRSERPQLSGEWPL